MNRSSMHQVARQGNLPARPSRPLDPERTPRMLAILPACNQEAAIEARRLGFQELFRLWRNLDRELADDGATRRLPLWGATLRAPS